jgi:ATP-dependent DNA helicase RecG
VSLATPAYGHQPITALKGVGAKVAEKLANLGLRTVQDVLFHLPHRYEDRTHIYNIVDLYHGIHATIQGEVIQSDIVFGRRRALVIKIKDASGIITCRFFYFYAAQKAHLSPGTQIRAFGEYRRGKHALECVHPEYKVVNPNDTAPMSESLTPVYPTTDGVKQITLRNLTEQALLAMQQGALAELMPAGMYAQQISLNEALHIVHRPPPDVSLHLFEEGKHPAQQRLILEELMAHQVSVLKMRANNEVQPGFAIAQDDELQQRFLATLPFAPTNAQARVVREIQHDMHQPYPMMRLVQGDVGSGKTLVAALAALNVISAGYQVVLMAPTELLAEQHAQNFATWFTGLGIHVGWLAGKLKGKAREQVLTALVSGDINLLVGTHAVFQEKVIYHNLAMVIIDEQHRFGVHQRLALREKGEMQGRFPHQLVMTATPIPRTLAMTAYADLNTSVIDELPPGRTPVQTIVVPSARRDQIMARVHKSVTVDSRQVYWVCTLIEESEVLQSQAAEDTYIALKTALPDLQVGLVHGRMKPAEKQAIMAQFKAAELDVLVATTVIEVGVDVPNASLMIIENPERLGLAQLHQLRGRVGRGSVESHCVLMYDGTLSKTATKRLGVLRDSNDGFYIAQMDLEIRGPGEILGTKQTGIADLKIADLVRDGHLLDQVQQLAADLFVHHPANAQAMINRWLGAKEQYSNA